MKMVRRRGDMPTEEHFAVIEYSSIHIPADERSRTNPGHGYPASDEAVVEYTAFASEEELLAWVKNHERFSGRHTSFTVISARPVKLETEIRVVK